MHRLLHILIALSLAVGGEWALGYGRDGRASAQAETTAAEPELLLQQAAQARNQGSCDAAEKPLEPLLGRADAYGLRARLLAGLYAHACELPRRAEELLARAEGADRELEDWRLWVLADSAVANDHRETALTALTRLLAHHADSPLRARAMHRAATLAWEAAQHDRARHLVEMARYEGLGGEPGEELETLAWQIAGATGDVEGRQETARQLLARYPFKAAELKVVELFRPESGGLAWTEILPPQMLLQRSRSLLDARLPGNAVQALQEIPVAERTLAWYLLAAEALIADHRGSEALRLLAAAAPRTPAETARVQWWRGLAAQDMAAVRSGRANLDAAGRDTMRRSAYEHLTAVVQRDADRELTLEALRRMFEAQVEWDEFDRSIEVLARLRELDPHDTTGARYLWELGWREYTRRNWTGAIGTWAELLPLYGDSAYARAGRYWSARAHESLGQRERANEIYQRLLTADTTDFYSRQALTRLGGTGSGRSGGEGERFVPPTDPWPEDPPVLARAQRLADLGLPHLALAEIEARTESAPSRAGQALQARLLYRTGEYRPAIHTLSKVFPALGTALQGGVPMEARQMYYPLAYEDVVVRHAGARGLSPELVLAMIRQESAFDAAAVSRSGARGLMQIMPATGRELALRLGLSFSTGSLDDPDYSIRLGTTYFRQVLDMFGGSEELALAGYNNGPFRIKRLWQEAGPDRELDLFLETLAWDETRSYVKRILIHQDSYRQLYPELG
ncbi:MAG: transglycosylase SLT domain-containing protein [Thermoanaerobaculia bacterium]